MTDNRDSNWEKIAGKLHGELNREEEAEFTRMMTDEAFLHEFKKAQLIYDNLKKTGSISAIDKSKSWTKVETGIGGNRLRWIKQCMKYAAILIVALSIGSVGYRAFHQHQKSYVFTKCTNPGKGNQSRLFLSNGTTVDLEKYDSKIVLNADQKIVIDNGKEIDLRKNSKTEESEMNEIVIPYGKKSHLILEDGTKVWLNAGSRMAFPTKFTSKKRELFLEGEAYFEVAHNEKLPFIVRTGDIAVKVLGTRFNLSTFKTDNLTEIVLLEGMVSIVKTSVLGLLNSETILTPNQKASFNRLDQTIIVNNESNAEYAIAWTEGWFKCSQQSINLVLNKLQRYYNVQFIIDPEFQTTDLITGKLDLKESIEEVMAVLSDVTNLKYSFSGNQIFISKK